MEVVIRTADTSEVDPEEVAEAIEAAGYFVYSVTVTALPGGCGDERTYEID